MIIRFNFFLFYPDLLFLQYLSWDGGRWLFTDIHFLFIMLILSCRNQWYGCFTWKLFSRVTSKQMKCCCPLHCIVLLLVWSLDRSNVREFDVLWYIFERDEGRNSGRHPVIKSVETACFIFIFQIVGCP